MIRGIVARGEPEAVRDCRTTDPRVIKILHALAEGPADSIRRIALTIGTTGPAIRTAIDALAAAGLIIVREQPVGRRRQLSVMITDSGRLASQGTAS